ncbi:MAG: hypothetical protein ACLQAT_14480 [Candidatus Binataceae bacterium]
MSSLLIGSIIFFCVFGGALLGIVLRSALPENHFSAESKDAVKVGIGLIATMTALVLGLLVSTAKVSFDTKHNELIQMSADTLLLDRVLANYGPETKAIREEMRRAGARSLEMIWPQKGQAPQLEPATGGEVLYDMIEALSPNNDAQRSLKAQALQLAIEILKTRWLLFEQSGRSISTPFLIVVVFWLTVIFMSFGLFAPHNATVVATFLVCALSVSGAIFLIIELDWPFQGLIQISSAPFRDAVARLGK